jgi:hypothetical protein
VVGLAITLGIWLLLWRGSRLGWILALLGALYGAYLAVYWLVRHDANLAVLTVLAVLSTLEVGALWSWRRYFRWTWQNLPDAPAVD